MHQLETVLLLLIFVIGLAIIARRLNLAFPILLTVGGLFISFFPGLPNVDLDSSVVLVVFYRPCFTVRPGTLTGAIFAGIWNLLSCLPWALYWLPVSA